MKRLLAILFTIHCSLFTVYGQYTTSDDITYKGERDERCIDMMGVPLEGPDSVFLPALKSIGLEQFTPEDPDPEGVTENDMVARYVTVQPNPATNEARVLSSFGLTRIEAFDAGGRQVMGREATGVEATLDVTSWPRGTYLLRITTPLGTATKKLLVQ